MTTGMVRESTPTGNRRAKVHLAELAPGNCGRQYSDRCSDEHWAKRRYINAVDDPVGKREALGGSKMLSGVSLFCV